ncbi:MAG TPA: anthranilate synthase component I [Thermoanaerobaculia bacterium]|jgi:anthranilate synthase component 1|nr:anthranilate synthase component I [Thermoanaerobaculia bacterium]
MLEPETSYRPRRAVPHIREFLADSLTPLAVYRRLAALSPHRFLFESVSGGERVSRFSFLGAAPREIYRLYPDRLEVERKGRSERLDGDPLDALHGALSSIASEEGSIPFTGGFVGYFGYDLIRLVERLPHRPPDPFDLPVALLARFDTLVLFDHAHQRVLAIANEIEGEIDVVAAERDLARLSKLLTEGADGGGVAMPGQPPGSAATDLPSLDSASFRLAVLKAKEYIAAGDIFQVVLARRWRVPRRIEPFALYRALRMVNPSPYMVLLETPDVSLVGASPEMLVRKQGRRIETRPIAGTRPRGLDAEGDRRLAEDLLADPKERAEHVMLVDLGRNDLGRVAVPGSVRVPTFMEIEHYSHVMHLVSSVEAELEEGRDGLDALLACFPAGTVSGAPKIRAMEIIDELETQARGPYAGAVGYLSFSGDLDTCIAIRTLVVRDHETSVTAGAGIVADSDPIKEEQETKNKAAALLAAVALAEELERRS